MLKLSKIVMEHLLKTNIYFFGYLYRKNVMCWLKKMIVKNVCVLIPQAEWISGLAKLTQFI